MSSPSKCSRGFWYLLAITADHTRRWPGYVDKKSSQAIRSVRAIHLVECVWVRFFGLCFFPGGIGRSGQEHWALGRARNPAL
jgi:hypothetical protein